MENILVFIRIIFDILISGEWVIEDIWGGFVFHDVHVKSVGKQKYESLGIWTHCDY